MGGLHQIPSLRAQGSPRKGRGDRKSVRAREDGGHQESRASKSTQQSSWELAETEAAARGLHGAAPGPLLVFLVQLQCDSLRFILLYFIVLLNE